MSAATQANITAALDRYIELTSAKKAIDAEMKTLSAEILSRTDEDSTKFVRGDITVQLKTRTNWKYSDAIALLKNKLKAEEKAEQIKGIATSSITRFLSVTGL